MKLPKNWNAQAHALWQANKRQEAIDAVLAAVNASRPVLPHHAGVQLAYYMAMTGGWGAAAQVLDQVCRAYPDDLESLKNLGSCLYRSGNFARSAETAEAVLKRQPDNYDAWDGLASSCAKLDRFDEARRAGEQSLALKDRQAGDVSREPLRLPGVSPAEFARQVGKRNVISFSLWGSQPRYLRGALRNALLAPDLYPGWECRFYVDDSVPVDFLKALRHLGAHLVIEADTVRLNDRQRLARRFWVANEPDVGYFLVRDCDAVIGVREAGAVGEWLASDRWFHVMRDWWTHTDLMLAGMWGGVAGVLPDLRALFDGYAAKHIETPNWDQWFLRDCVWKLVRDHCLVHDRCFRIFDSRPFPGEEPGGTTHVGQDEFANRRAWQERMLTPWIATLPCLKM